MSNLRNSHVALSNLGVKGPKMMHSGSDAEWEVGIGHLGFFVAMIIHDMCKLFNIKTPLPPMNARDAIVGTGKKKRGLLFFQGPLPHFLLHSACDVTLTFPSYLNRSELRG